MPRAHNQGLVHVHGGPARHGWKAYTSEASALFARMSLQPSSTRKNEIDTLIGALVSAGVWAKLDALYVFAAHDAQAAVLNWKQDLYNCTPIDDPQFDTDLGFTGDGTSSYLDTGFNPDTATSPNFLQDNSSMGVWSGTEVNATQYDCGSTSAAIVSRASSNALTRSSSPSSDTWALPAETSIGLTMFSRSDGDGYVAQRDTAAATSIVRASVALQSLPFYILARSNAGPVAANHSARRIQACFFGGSLTSGQRNSLYIALNTYMTAVGAV